MLHITLTSRKATGWSEIIRLTLITLFLIVVEDYLISNFITLPWLASKPCTERYLQMFRECRFALQKVLLCFLSILSTCYVFARVYVHQIPLLLNFRAKNQHRHINISYEPAQKAEVDSSNQVAAELESSNQVTAIDRSNAEDTATQHTVGKNVLQATMLPQRHSMPSKRKSTKLPRRNRVPQQHAMPSTLNNKDKTNDKATAAAPERPAGATMDIGDTVNNVRAVSPSPRVLLRRTSTASDWKREILTQISTISKLDEASEVVPSPEGASAAILAQERPPNPSPSPRQALEAMRDTLAQDPDGSHSLFRAGDWRSKYGCCLDGVTQS